MKRRTIIEHGAFSIMLLLAVSLVAFASPALAQTNVSIDSVTVDVDEIITLPIMINNVTDLDGVGTADIKLLFDSNVVHVIAATTGDFDSTTRNLGHNESGTDSYVKFVANQASDTVLTGDVLVTTVTLKAVGTAGQESPLNITILMLADNSIDGNEIPADDVDGTFRIAGGAVPPTCTVSVTNTTITPPQATDITMTVSEYVHYTLNIETGDGTVVSDWSGNRKTSYTVAWNGTYETNGTQVPDGTYTLNLTVTNETTGLSGNNRTETIVVSSGDDTIAPTADANTPTGTGVPVSTAISVTFSEAMNTTSTEDAFSITPDVAGSVGWDGCVMTFTPDDDLAYNTTYNVTIGTGAEDLAGNPLAKDFVWNFTTESDADPTTGTNVSIDSVTVDVDEIITLPIMINNVTDLDGVGTADIKLLFDSNVVHVIAATTGDFDSTTRNLGHNESGTDSYVKFVANQASDTVLTGDVLVTTVTLKAVGTAGQESPLNITILMLADNSIDGNEIPADDVDGTFRIGAPSTIPPTCTVSMTNATIVPPQTTDITVTFSEKVQYTLNIETSDGMVVRDWSGNRETSYTVAWNGTYETNGTQVPDGTYTLNLTVTNETTGLSGNNRTETIVVSSGDDTTAPTVTAKTPTGTDVSVSTAISVTFSEAMNKTSVEDAFSINPVAGSVSWDGNMMTFTPDSNLAYDTTYNVTIGTGAEDLAGNPLEAEFVWNFTTGSAPADNGGSGGGGGSGTYPPGWGEPAPTSAATPAPTAAPEPTVASTKAPTEAPTKAPTKAPTVAATEIETTELKTEGTPGFGALATVFAIAGLLVAAYLVMRRRE